MYKLREHQIFQYLMMNDGYFGKTMEIIKYALIIGVWCYNGWTFDNEWNDWFYDVNVMEMKSIRGEIWMNCLILIFVIF